MPKEAAKIVYENVHKALNERENDETGKNAPQIVTSVKSSAEQIREYKGLLDDGIITQTEFDAKKKELLNLWQSELTITESKQKTADGTKAACGLFLFRCIFCQNRVYLPITSPKPLFL